MTCVDIELQAPFNSGSLAVGQVLLSGYGSVYLSEVVSEFGPKA